MATSVRLIRRYVWLVDTIRRAGSITLEDINRKWAYNTSLNIDKEDEIPERTFHRHRDAIAELFDIEICCNRYDGNKYYIKNDEMLDKPSFTSWLFNGLSIDNQMMDNHAIAERIIFEEIPGGTEYLSPIIEAISKNKKLSIGYKRFNRIDITQWIVSPACIKESERRWYMIGKIDDCGSYTVFALDRIQELSICSESFDPINVNDVKIKFNEIIGVNLDNDFDCEEVSLRIFGKQRPYVEALPIHPSQRRILETDEYSDYQFTIRPEYEFQRRILSLGPEVEILSPEWLREELKWLAEGILKHYSIKRSYKSMR